MTAGPRSKMYGGSTIHVPDDVTVIGRAQDVAIERGRMVAETLFHIAAVRTLPGVPSVATIGCEAAKLQDVTATGGHQAAHLLPGAITVNGTYVWNVPDGLRLPAALARDVLRLQGQLMWCFGKTSVLPAYVNRADSEAERTDVEDGPGLKVRFGEVVQELWSSARVRADAPLVVDRQAVMKALGRWFGCVNLVYALAEKRKRRRAGEVLGEKPGAYTARMREARVLRTYAETFVVQNPERFVEAHARDVAHRYRWL